MKKTLTKEQLAAKLDGMDYVEELPDEIIEIAKQNNLVILHGDNRDWVHLDGAITDDIYAYEGAKVRFDKDGFFECPCENYHHRSCKEHFKRALASGDVIELKAWWCGRYGSKNMDELAYAMLGKPAWCFDCGSIEGKFAAFKIKERQDYGPCVEYFCLAVILDLDEIWPETQSDL